MAKPFTNHFIVGIQRTVGRSRGWIIMEVLAYRKPQSYPVNSTLAVSDVGSPTTQAVWQRRMDAWFFGVMTRPIGTERRNEASPGSKHSWDSPRRPEIKYGRGWIGMVNGSLAKSRCTLATRERSENHCCPIVVQKRPSTHMRWRPEFVRSRRVRKPTRPFSSAIARSVRIHTEVGLDMQVVSQRNSRRQTTEVVTRIS